MNSDIVFFKNKIAHDVGYNFLSSSGYTIYSTLLNSRFKIFIFKVCRKLKIYNSLLLKFLWNLDIPAFSNTAYIVIFNSSIEHYFCNSIKKQFKNVKHILYYWDKIDKPKETLIDYFRSNWDIFSFNSNDCEKYNLKYNKLFFNIPINFHSNDRFTIQQDIFFVGNNKGRINQLLEIKNELDKLNISYKIVCTNAEKYADQGIITTPISYEETLIEDLKSKAILDINLNDMLGMTMRELETLYFKKKLITNNVKILERDFYHPDNIFIIDYSKESFLEGLKEFLDKPFYPIDTKIIESYSVESWIEHFKQY